MIIERLSLSDAFYFSIVTVTTVGYGDIHPVTVAGKILTILLIVMGVGTFLGVVANATEIMLNKRERKVRLEKLNMVIGTFFSEVGTQLLADFSKFDLQLERMRKDLIVTNDWSEKDFLHTIKVLQNVDLEHLRTFLFEKRDFLLRLLENPTLLEHESFTHLLRAVFHLTEELACREDVRKLPDTDKAHLAGDIKRSYALLVHQWLTYMKYLKNHYRISFLLPYGRILSIVRHPRL